jgi:sugar phosphate isomerase/epimerase
MFEPGVMFWAERDTLDAVVGLGVRYGQLGIPGGMALTDGAAEWWKDALARAGFTLVTVFAAYQGEDYADMATVARTVGFVPLATRAERLARTVEVSDFAARLGVGSIACHVGCVPEDAGSADYEAVRDMVRRVCDHAGRHGQSFALETGQEPAGALLRFIGEVDRGNLRINFDPANMILYGTGEPIAALERVAPLVVSVHCKDGDWPVPGEGKLGRERPLGKGSVGIARFVEALGKAGFRGQLNVEREADDVAERWRDLAEGVRLVRELGRA